jgi:hypothetical protein
MPIARLNPRKRTIDDTVAPLESMNSTKKDFLRIFQTETIIEAHMRARIRLSGKARNEKGILPVRN